MDAHDEVWRLIVSPKLTHAFLFLDPEAYPQAHSLADYRKSGYAKTHSFPHAQADSKADTKADALADCRVC
jgi:hypothetical protein